MEQAQENGLLVQAILNSPEVSYGLFRVPGHGVVTLDRKKGKQFIGNKLSHMRKPSAYKGKTSNRVCTMYNISNHISSGGFMQVHRGRAS